MGMVLYSRKILSSGRLLLREGPKGLIDRYLLILIVTGAMNA